jgi:hypothetical protein
MSDKALPVHPVTRCSLPSKLTGEDAMIRLSRRRLGLAAGALALPRLARAQSRTLNAFGHRVHRCSA